MRQAVAQLLQHHGVEILQMETEPQSLEEIFLSAIGNETRP
jgi:hypothetical protein